MPYYNTVLLPPPPLAGEITRFAQENFAAVADGYCLSAENNVLPHISLCQFKAEDFDFSSFKNMSCSLTPILTELAIRYGDDIHEGYLWLELAVQKTDGLLGLQCAVRTVLERQGLSPLNGQGDNYIPHLTFCRIMENNFDGVCHTLPPKTFFLPAEGWRFAVGQADGNGQFLGTI